jgi:hypothetical protein
MISSYRGLARRGKNYSRKCDILLGAGGAWRVLSSLAASRREKAMGAGAGVLTVEEFERRLAELERQSRAETTNQGSLGSERCLFCKSCMFCSDCEHCYRCNYCEACRECSQCTKCRRCESCHSCAYCDESLRCMGSAFLVRCTDCSECTYCFGCVGLSRKDFYILNQTYDRTTYFRIVASLKRGMGLA